MGLLRCAPASRSDHVTAWGAAPTSWPGSRPPATAAPLPCHSTDLPSTCGHTCESTLTASILPRPVPPRRGMCHSFVWFNHVLTRGHATFGDSAQMDAGGASPLVRQLRAAAKVRAWGTCGRPPLLLLRGHPGPRRDGPARPRDAQPSARQVPQAAAPCCSPTSGTRVLILHILLALVTA